MKVEIELNEEGYGKAKIDGEYVSEHTMGMSFYMMHGHNKVKPTVTMYANNGMKIVHENVRLKANLEDVEVVIVTMNNKRYRVVEEYRTMS